MRTWKKIVLIGISGGVGLVLGLAVIVAGYSWYENRPVPVRTWPTLEIKSIGVNAMLKTQWRDGMVRYQFKVTPNEPGLAEAFNDVSRALSASTHFGAHLEDSAGFELCKLEIKDFMHNSDSVGRIVALETQGSDYGCSRSEYLAVNRWRVSWNFPSLKQPGNEGGTFAPGGGRADRPKPTVAKWKQKANWRQLKVGMTKGEVRATLGEPGKITKYSYSEDWYYPNILGGEVSFGTDGRVKTWREP